LINLKIACLLERRELYCTLLAFGDGEREGVVPLAVIFTMDNYMARVPFFYGEFHPV
jgi:hypothetical protein